MKIRFLLIGTSLSLIPQTINAQCVATQDCATLGYTETSCSGGSGVKCPFGNKWACFKSDSEVCQQYGFTQTCTGAGQLGKGESCANLYKQCDCQDTYKYACTGTNQTGGVGKSCNGKYSECTCIAGYIWNNSSQTCENTCIIGALYYSDGTCSNKLESSKTLLGVVIYEKSSSQNGWIMTVKPIQTGIKWGDGTTTGITDKTVSASCTNTQKLVAKGSSYKAAITANNYKPTGTPSNKSWCLPSYDLLNNINNYTNFSKVNAGIATAEGTILGTVYDVYEHVWSSSEYDYGRGLAWYFRINRSSFNMAYNDKNNGLTYVSSIYSVRPVLAF